MQLRRAPRFATPRNPTFLWQGALILLPAIVLCALGLYSLRQDRALAEHQALERAKTIATEASQRILQGPLRSISGPDAALIDRAKSGLGSPVDDPVWQAAQAPGRRIGFLLDEEDRLLYPPPVSPLPLPQPVDLDDLNPQLRAAWDELQQRIAGRQLSGSGDPALAAFLQAAPPVRFAALAQYRAGIACRQEGREGDALALFGQVSEAEPPVLAEDGFPLSLFADAQIVAQLGLLPEVSRKAELNRFCGQALANPTALSEKALAWAVQFDRFDDTALRWKELFDAHTCARAIAAVFATAPHPADSLEFLGEPHLILSQAAANGRWVQAIPRRELAGAIAQLVQSQAIPEQFSFDASLGTLSLLSAHGKSPVGDALATVISQVPSEPGNLPLTIRVSLANPARYYADQRTRTLRFAALIALSALAVLIGFFSAWRAFRRQQRLNEMKTNFVSSVSHELRAPIASVRFMAEELELGAAPSAEKLRNYHRFIVQECRRLSAVIENVLDFSRREQGREHFEFEDTDLVRLLEDTARLMRAYGADRRVAIETVVHGDPAEVEADGRALQRLLVNLLDNALKHSPEDGCVRTGVDFHRAHVFLWVEDDGPGIPLEEQERIFERFYRIGSELRRETQGVGLGLSIVKHIASVHGGAIRLRSGRGSGSRFTLELPFARKSEMPALEI